MARALRAYPPPAVQLPPPNGPTAVDRLRKAVTDAGENAITCQVPVSVVAGVLETLESARLGLVAAEHDARAARVTTERAIEQKDRANEALSQAEARHRSAMKQAAKEKASA